MTRRFKAIQAISGVIAVVLIGLAPLEPALAARQHADALVFAAASLQTGLDELSGPVLKATGVRIRVSYAASSVLARQIENGAPADIFISADLDWMDYLADRRLIRATSRVNLLGNRLVLIAPQTARTTLSIAPGFPLAAQLGSGRLAVGDPAAVPAGRYARRALTSLGVWDAVAGRLAPADNVRAALRLVARGEAPLGIVYRTDALAEAAVRIVDTFPETTHPPIVYPMALMTTANEAATRVAAFLRSAAATRTFEALGFTVPRQ